MPPEMDRANFLLLWHLEWNVADTFRVLNHQSPAARFAKMSLNVFWDDSNIWLVGRNYCGVR